MVMWAECPRVMTALIIVRLSPIAAPKACASDRVAKCWRVRSRGVRPRAATKWAAFFRQKSSCIVWRFMAASVALRWLQTAVETEREQLLSHCI